MIPSSGVTLDYKNPDIFQKYFGKECPFSEGFLCDLPLSGCASTCGGTAAVLFLGSELLSKIIHDCLVLRFIMILGCNMEFLYFFITTA